MMDRYAALPQRDSNMPG